RMLALMPAPPSLLMVVAPAAWGMPAPRGAWRAGAWPRPAGSTQPMTTSSTWSAARLACASAPSMAVAPRVGVGTPVNWPRNEPMAVRLAPTMTMSDMGVSGCGPATRGRNHPIMLPDAAVPQTAAGDGAGERSSAPMALPRVVPPLPRNQGAGPARASAVALEQLPPDQHAPDFVGAGADGIQLRVAQDPPGRVLVDVAVAAQRLGAFQRDLHGRLGGVQQAAGRVDARLVAGVVVARDLVGEGAAGLQRGVHVGDLALHQAEGADRTVELLPLAHVGQGGVERGLHQA